MVGMDVVDAICAAAQPVDRYGTIAADGQPVMTSVTIRTESANKKVAGLRGSPAF